MEINKKNTATFRLSQRGFTLIELIVVLAIMGTMLGLVLVNLNAQRTPRSMKIAQNELVTNIRKVQSYTLAGRGINNNQDAVQYYAIKFDLNSPTKYTVQAVYNIAATPPLVKDIETINLPSGVKLSAVTINGTAITTGAGLNYNCGLLYFAAPFGKVYTNDGCLPNPLPQSPYNINSSPYNNYPTNSNDYQKVVNFVTNVNCAQDAAACTIRSDSVMVITLSDLKNTMTNTVTINGVTGVISFQ